jgi:hypothetical protein
MHKTWSEEQICAILDGAPDKFAFQNEYDDYYESAIDEIGGADALLKEILVLRERVERLERKLDRYKDNPFIIPLAPKGEHQ